MKDLLSSLPKSADFLAFWKLYPRKVDKLAAFHAYQKARRIASSEEILIGLRLYPFRADAKHQPHAASWLNRGGWMVEDDTPPPTVIVNGHGERSVMTATLAIRGDYDEPDDKHTSAHDSRGYR